MFSWKPLLGHFAFVAGVDVNNVCIRGFRGGLENVVVNILEGAYSRLNARGSDIGTCGSRAGLEIHTKTNVIHLPAHWLNDVTSTPTNVGLRSDTDEEQMQAQSYQRNNITSLQSAPSHHPTPIRTTPSIQPLRHTHTGTKHVIAWIWCLHNGC
jgi:hypothetical protein